MFSIRGGELSFKRPKPRSRDAYVIAGVHFFFVGLMRFTISFSDVQHRERHPIANRDRGGGAWIKTFVDTSNECHQLLQLKLFYQLYVQRAKSLTSQNRARHLSC